MNYETSRQAAERLGVSIDVVQEWAQENRIPGAAQSGRSWMISADFVPADLTDAQPEHAEGGSAFDDAGATGPDGNAQPERAEGGCFAHIAMPLMNSAYPVGRCREFIASIPDGDERAIAWGEYYYYSGQAEQAARVMEPYQDSADPMLRGSANLVGFFANLSRGNTQMAMHAFERLQEDLQKEPGAQGAPLQRAIGALVVTTASVLLHLPVAGDVDLQQCISCLPEGLKLWACYLLAHKAYLEKNYNGSLAIAELSLAINPKLYPVSAIYVHLVAAMDMMSLKRVQEARQHVAQAWALAQPDGLIEPFGEHHGLLQGMIERFFQEDDPEMFERIIAITYSFSAGWRKIHNPLARQAVADNLTTTEFTIAMLYNRGWTAKEIASYMNLSPRTITNTIQVIYQKLGISGKRELQQFMLA